MTIGKPNMNIKTVSSLTTERKRSATQTTGFEPVFCVLWPAILSKCLGKAKFLRGYLFYILGLLGLNSCKPVISRLPAIFPLGLPWGFAGAFDSKFGA